MVPLIPTGIAGGRCPDDGNLPRTQPSSALPAVPAYRVAPKRRSIGDSCVGVAQSAEACHHCPPIAEEQN